MSPKKALSKTRESGADGVNMKVVSEFYCCWVSKVMSFRILESIWGVTFRKEAIAASGRCCTMPGQRCISSS